MRFHFPTLKKGGCLLFKIKAFFFLKSLQFNFFNYLLKKKKTLQLDPACLGRAHEGCHQVSQILKTLSSLPNLQLWPTLLLRAGSAPLEGLQLCPGPPAPLQKTVREVDTPRIPESATFIFQTILLKCAKSTRTAQMYEQEKKKKSHVQ